ncbi:hypothetical protein MMC18_008082 [Xylographa bjoerkii]|nr:hypothetical protein [Xylographa bjoerkii]
MANRMDFEGSETFDNLPYPEFLGAYDENPYGPTHSSLASNTTARVMASSYVPDPDSALFPYNYWNPSVGFLQQDTAELMSPGDEVSTSVPDAKFLSERSDTRLTIADLACTAQIRGHEDEEIQPRQRNNIGAWEGIRNHVEVSYMDNGHSLQRTMKIMKEEHGFHASTKAFKEWLNNWVFKKNVYKKDREYMVKLERRRRELYQKKSIFRFRGIAIPQVKIERWAKKVAQTGSIPSVPSFISCDTPPPRRRKQSHPSFTTVKRARLQEDADSNLSLSSLSLGTTTIQANISNQSFVGNPLYTTCFLPLRQLIIQVSISEHSQDETLDKNSNCRSARELESGLLAFSGHCRESNDIAFALLCFTGGALSRLISDVFASKKWNVMISIKLPFLLCHARLSTASGRYSDGENLIDKVLLGYMWIHEADDLQRFKSSFPAVLLLAKAYLAQSKFFLLRKLVFTSLAEAEALERAVEVKEETLQLQKLLLIFGGVMLSVDEFAVSGFGMCLNEEHLLHDILAILKDNDDENEFTLGLLSYLRGRYDKTWVLERLEPILESMEEIIHRTIEANSDQPGSPIMIDAIRELIRSYYPLRKWGAITRWRKELNRQTSVREAVTAQRVGSASKQVLYDEKQEKGLDSRSPDFPLKLIFKRFLWQEWPCIPLP